MTPAQIDAYVRRRMDAGQDLYSLHAGALSVLDPDLILTQDLCRVCAIPSGDVQDALDHLGCRADVLALDPHTLAEVLDTLLIVGRRTGTADRAVKSQRRLERVYRRAMSALVEVDDLREVTARRELYRRLARTSEGLIEVAERVWYSVLKES